MPVNYLSVSVERERWFIVTERYIGVHGCTCDGVKRGTCERVKGCARRERVRAVQRDVRARMHACKRESVRGCVERAREMCTTTIQILLLLLREQSPVNRLPRHNVSIQVRSGVLNRSAAPLRPRFSKNPRERTRLSRSPDLPSRPLCFLSATESPTPPVFLFLLLRSFAFRRELGVPSSLATRSPREQRTISAEEERIG